MIQQQVKGKGTTPLQGIALILGLLAGLLAASLLSNAMTLYLDNSIGSIAVWLATIGIAVYIMRDRVLEYRYTVDRGRFYVERLYGLHGKVLVELSLKDILDLDEEKAVLERHPGVKYLSRATLKACPVPKKVLAYRAGGETQLIAIQPSEEIEAALRGGAQAARG